jgi:hypothetical protein
MQKKKSGHEKAASIYSYSLPGSRQLLPGRFDHPTMREI